MEIVTDHISILNGFSELIRVLLINNNNEEMVYYISGGDECINSVIQIIK